MLPVVGVFAQDAPTPASAGERLLVDVLHEIENRFAINIRYDPEMIAGKTLRYADWRIKPWSAEESLTAVLAPFDYKFVAADGNYTIRAFEYARTTAAEGKKFLDYLETLYPDSASWEARKAALKPCLLKALRLSPMPEKPASEIILTPKRSYDGYTVENFAIETLPGIYVCGSLYKPVRPKGKCPVILNPNGHFENGRYREDHQMRCATQARMGALSASWDLFAWGESRLCFDEALHRLNEANSIQVLNAVRILDYLLSLKEADPSGVGITGGSGGGSMTMMLSAVDDRITVSIPVVMLSSHFVGGCPCESGMSAHLCGGRTNNAEIAALFAPKPQMVVTDGEDWSSSVPELELPYLKKVYGFYGAEDCVENVHFPTEGHDYGRSKRIATYRFLAAHLGLNHDKVDASKVTIEKESQMRAFGENGEKTPANAAKGREALQKVLRQAGIILDF
jgi:hypothetical protein